MSKYNTKIFAPQYIPTGGVDLSKDKLFDLTRFEELREKVFNIKHQYEAEGIRYEEGV